MIKQLYQNVKDGLDIRKNLIEIKKAIKDENEKRALLFIIGEDYSLFEQLLSNEDAKTRKNAALILGELEIDTALDILYRAYEKESQLFVKSSYLMAISHYDYNKYLNKLKDRLKVLTDLEIEESTGKHIREEIRVLEGMIFEYEKPESHKFDGYHKSVEIILTTNPNHKSLLASLINNNSFSEMPQGLFIKTSRLEEILPIRIYNEILFPLSWCENLETDPIRIGETILKSNLLILLSSLHEGDFPFYFRIELRSKMNLEVRSSFTKKLAGYLEEKTNRKIINSTSNYEIELRLVESKNGTIDCYLKLYTIKDKRFAYRKKTIAGSIHPVTAALIMELTKQYMKEDGQILDPFCGVGTMLIERNKKVPASPVYGIDIFSEAISKARENSKKEGIIINYINRNYFDFKHDYPFDEIITNMPAKSGSLGDKELDMLYRDFFFKSKEILADTGIIIMYSGEKDLIKKYLRLNKDLKLMREFLINKREDAYVFVIRMVGK